MPMLTVTYKEGARVSYSSTYLEPFFVYSLIKIVMKGVWPNADIFL